MNRRMRLSDLNGSVFRSRLSAKDIRKVETAIRKGHRFYLVFTGIGGTSEGKEDKGKKPGTLVLEVDNKLQRTIVSIIPLEEEKRS